MKGISCPSCEETFKYQMKLTEHFAEAHSLDKTRYKIQERIFNTEEEFQVCLDLCIVLVLI